MKTLPTLLLCCACSFTFAQPGTIDSGFGTDGMVLIDVFEGEDSPTGIDSYNNQPIMGGYSVDWLYEFVLMKFNEDGSFDTDFSGDGMVDEDFFELSNAFCTGLVVLDNGEMILCGHSTNEGEFIFFQGFMKFQTNGSIDQSFGNNGKVQIWDEGNESIRTWDAIHGNGDYLLACGSYGNSPTWASVTKIDLDGNLEIPFGNGGIARFATDAQATSANGVVEMPSGRIITAGQIFTWETSLNSYLVGFDENGDLDTDFGVDGEVIIGEANVVEEYRTIVLYDGTHFLAAGHIGDGEDRDGVIRMFDEDGNLDTSFGNNGELLIDYLEFKDDIKDLVVQTDGKILVGMEGEDESGQDDFVVIRLNADGSFDNTFGVDGLFTITGEDDDDIMRMALQDDGKLLVAGIKDGEDSIGLDHMLVRVLTAPAIGIHDLGNDSAIPLIYPNPVQDRCTFQFELDKAQAVDLFLMDSQGRIVRTFESAAMWPEGANLYEIDMSSFFSGMYFLVLQTESGQARVQLTKE